MKKLIPTILLTLAIPTLAQQLKPDEAQAPPIAEKQAVTDFIRVHQTAQKTYLQTAVTRYTKDGTNVDLIGAVHIADKTYFDILNKEFKNYQALLFEMVGGEQMQNGKMPKKQEAKKQASLSFLGTAYTFMQNTLDLAGQKEHIDYTAKNFIHADLSLKEFADLQKKKGESILSFALAQSKNVNAEKQPSVLTLLSALIAKNPDKLKLALVHTLGGGDDKVGALAGDSVIIGDRNHKALQVMDQQIKAGNTHIGIFYGAAHFPDMEKRLLKQGFKKTTHRYLNAWTIDKEKAQGKKPKPQQKQAA